MKDNNIDQKKIDNTHIDILICSQGHIQARLDDAWHGLDLAYIYIHIHMPFDRKKTAYIKKEEKKQSRSSQQQISCACMCIDAIKKAMK